MTDEKSDIKKTHKVWYAGKRLLNNSKIGVVFICSEGGHQHIFRKSKGVSILNLGAKYPLGETTEGKWRLPDLFDVIKDEDAPDAKIDEWRALEIADMGRDRAARYKTKHNLDLHIDAVRNVRERMSHAKRVHFDAWLIKKIFER